MSDIPDLFCSTCNKSFTRPSALVSHNKSKTHLQKIGGLNKENSEICPKCKVVFLKNGIKTHVSSCTGIARITPVYIYCPICNKRFTTKTGLEIHTQRLHTFKDSSNESGDFDDLHFIENIGEEVVAPTTISLYISKYFKEMLKCLKKTVKEFKFLKWKVTLHLKFARHDAGQNFLNAQVETHFNYLFKKIIKSHILEKTVSQLEHNMEMKMEEINPSNLILYSITHLDLECWKINPLEGKSYIPLNFKSNYLVNIKNDDDKCFVYSVLAHLYPAENHANRVSKYKGLMDSLDINDLEFPMKIEDIPKFEKLNDLRINVYGLFSNDTKDLFPLSISDNITQPDPISLLYIETDEKHHYVLIKNFQRFIKEQLGSGKGFYYCERCLTRTTSQNMKELHERLCVFNKPTKMLMPPKGGKMKFNKYFAKTIPFAIIYGDFEAINNVLVENVNNECQTKKLTQQTASSYCLYVKSNYENLYKSREYFYRGTSSDDTLKHFVQTINDLENEFKFLVGKGKDGYYINKPLIKPIPSFNSETTICWLCEEGFNDDETPVVDHDHFNGKFRGYAHNECNLQCPRSKVIPIVFHNGSNYDVHLYIKELAKNNKNCFKVIGKTKEEYISVQWGCLKFIDSLRFFPPGMSLDRAAKALNDKDFILLKEKLWNWNDYDKPRFGQKENWEKQVEGSDYFLEQTFKISREKGIFPYDWVDSFEKFNNRQLPPFEDFFSILYQSDIKKEEYARAQKMWSLFQCKTFGDYNDLYLRLDVYILADCFEKFRKAFSIDPCHFVSAPSLAWEVLLYSTKQTLELLDDLNMYQMINNNIRGGISSVMGSRKINSFNSKTLEEAKAEARRTGRISMDLHTEIKHLNMQTHILYIDAAALYSGIMTHHMPYKDFKWVEPTKKIIEKILTTPTDSETGYFLEVDLDYPREIHNKTKNFAFCPTRRNIDYSELSEFQKNIKQQQNGFKCENKSVPKLVCDQNNKTNYLLHYQNLQFYLQQGMKLKQVHHIISFKQSPWMKPYIDDNISKRAIAKSKQEAFGIEIRKLLNNAVFGKTMENLDKRRNIKLYNSNNIHMVQKIISRPTFKGGQKFSKELMAIEVGNYQKTYNKPIYLGFAILELSKLQMYKLYYETLQPTLGERVSLHYMDTDSNFLVIQSNNINQDLENLTMINTSGVLFSYKDESLGDPINEAIFIRSKQYSYRTESGENKKKNKGIQKSVVNKMTHEDYQKCISSEFKQSKQHVMVHAIQNKNHDIFLMEQNKLAFQNYDEKRYILSDGIQTLPFGHFRIKFIEILPELNKSLNTKYTDLDVVNFTKQDISEIKARLINSPTL